MKRIKMLGLMVVAVCSLSAVVASTASALEWLDNGKPIVQAAGLLVLQTGTLLLTDLITNPTQIICTGSGHGTVGPGPNDTIKSILASGCVFETGKNGSCEAGKPVNAKAVHLPWATRLLTVAGATRDMIENSGAGNPGWVVECSVLGGFKVQDTCESTTGDPKITSNASGDVTSTFEASETASCSLGNSTSGMVIGNTLIFSDVAGLKISTT
jgi:hypothetical protein